MSSVQTLSIAPAKPQSKQDWPPEADFILSALEAGRNGQGNRRHHTRLRYHVRAELQLFADGPGVPPWELYTRDVDQRSLGFITPHRLPLGYGGRLRLIAPNGVPVTIECTLLRCREAVSGWYEGALYFNREQWAFEG